MSGRDFLDTNVLVYSLDVAEPAKHKIARELVARAVAGEFTVSAQVNAELASTLLQKYHSKYTAADIVVILDSLQTIPLIKPDAEMVRRAVEAHAAYGIRYYDGMIVAAAERGGCPRIWSEDLNHGQKYFGVTVSNPF